MKRLALCLGLTRVDRDAYGGWDGDCPGCDRDAAAIATLCHDRGFDGVQVLINEAATKKRTEAAFLAIADSLSAGDLVVLFVSGHGGQQRDTDGDEEDRKDETLCLFDGELVDDAIGEYLCLLPANVRVLFLSDTCNSGSNYRGVRRARSTPVKLRVRAVGDFVGTLLHFGGCADGRYSYGADQGGAFTLALLDAIARARRPLSYAEWFRRAVGRMDRRKQAPVQSAWGNPDFSDREALT